MKKKLSLMLCLCIMALTLAACGSDSQDVDYGGMSYSDLQSSAQNLVTSIAASSDEELSAAIETNEQYAKQYAKQYGREYTEAEAVINLLQSWLDTTSSGVGEFVGLGEFSVDKTSDTVTVDQIVNFSEREVDVTFVYEYNYLTQEIEMTDATADVVYTMGEKLEKAALNTVMGLGTVFCVLILISLIIYCFKFISKVGAPKKETAKTEEVKTTAVENVNENLADELELVAVISAAIAASEGTSTDSFVVRSIHRR